MTKRLMGKRVRQRGKIGCEAMEPRVFLDAGVGHEAWTTADAGGAQPVLYQALDQELPPEAMQSGAPRLVRGDVTGHPKSESLPFVLLRGQGGNVSGKPGGVLGNRFPGKNGLNPTSGRTPLVQRLGNGGGLRQLWNLPGKNRLKVGGGDVPEATSQQLRLAGPGAGLGTTTPVAPVVATDPGNAAISYAPLGDASARSASLTSQAPGASRGDIVEADDRFLYILSRQDLVIVDTQGTGSAMAESSRQSIEGWPIAEYLDGDKLTVISGVTTPGIGAPGDPITLEAPAGGDAKLAATSMIAPDWGNQKVKVTEYDVSNRSSPKVLKETYLDGNYVDSHSVGSKTYVVVQENAAPPVAIDPAVTTLPALGTEAGISARPMLATDDYNAAAIEPSSEPITLAAHDAAVDAGFTTLPAWDAGKITVSVFDSANPGAGVVGSAEADGAFGATVYGTDDHLYLLTPQYANDTATTQIRSFALQGNSVVAEATGEVPGRVIGQSGISASDGQLRIVTTNDKWDESGNKSTSGVYVLGERDGKLEISGKVEGLASGASVSAAAFVGHDAFLTASAGQGGASLVTVDLADPKAPKVAGETATSASWTNFREIDGTHLLAVGREVDPSTGASLQLKVALLDVSDPGKPVVVSSQDVGPRDNNGGGGWSEAEYESRALGYYADSGIVTLPVSSSVAGADNDGDGFPDTWTSKSDLYVFRVDAAQGISAAGGIGHPTAVSRSAEVGNTLYSIGDTTVKANRLDAGLTDAGSLKIQEEYKPEDPVALPAYDGGPVTLPAYDGGAVASAVARGNGLAGTPEGEAVPASFQKFFDGGTAKVRRFRAR